MATSSKRKFNLRVSLNAPVTLIFVALCAVATLLGVLSDNATATGELETETESDPAVLSFKAAIPYFATVAGDAVSIQLPDFESSLFAIGGPTRKTPILVPGVSRQTLSYEIIFPEGCTEVEHLPESWFFAAPDDPGEIWVSFSAQQSIAPDGRLHVTVERTLDERPDATFFMPEAFGMLKAVNRRASCIAGRTISARRVR